MADTPTFQSNPYGSFDPTQWANPYSLFKGQALPWPSSYAGSPTNALGQPIAQPQGMTLNNTAAQPQAPAAQAQGAAGLQGVTTPQGLSQPAMGAPSVQGGLQAWGAATPAQRVAAMPQSVYGATGGNADKGSFGGLGPIGYVQQQPQAAAAAPAAASSAAPNNWQQTLSMLANPGHVTTPGATVPQAAPGGGQPSPGVLQNFLANWQPASSGPGSGFTQNFNTILRGLQAKGS